MATSSIPAFRAALRTRLAARAGLAGVQITDGAPANPAREMIALASTSAQQEYRGIGGPIGASKQETFDLEVIVSVLREGRDTTGADTRAFALLAEIEAAVRTDPTVNSTVDVAEISAYQHEPRFTDTAREANLVITIQAQKRI